MTNLIVQGGKPLAGTINPSGNKNAILPMLCATLLTNEEITFTHVPEISDVHKIKDYFESMGSRVEWDQTAERLTVQHPSSSVGEATLPTGIRSSILLLAPTIRRFGKLVFDTSSRGCELGMREIDPHLHILETFGCTLEGSHPYTIHGGGRQAVDMWADYASVTATETFIMMAALADGVSVLNNAACEPHVQDLCHFLCSMGAHISGIGTSRLEITGVDSLHSTEYRVIDDHHEVATFLAIGGITGGHIRVETKIGPHMDLIVGQLAKLGLEITREETALTSVGWSRQITEPLTREILQKVEAAPWPYYPADLLPQAIAVACGARGQVMFWNKIYEGALSWASDLAAFGVKVHLSDPHRLVVMGGNTLRPGSVTAPYIIRVAVAYLMLALHIEGESKIKQAGTIGRAHPNFIKRLNDLGADIRVEE